MDGVAGTTHSSLALCGMEEEKRVLQHPHFQKEETCRLYPLVSYLLGDSRRTPTPGGPDSRRKGMLELPTLSRTAWEMGQGTSLHLRGLRKKEVSKSGVMSQ